MPRGGSERRVGRRVFECEGCHYRWLVEVVGVGLEARCEKCGAVAYASPFPNKEALRRLDALAARLKEEGL